MKAAWPGIRDVLLFFGGLGIAINETLFEPAIRPEVLIFCASMMGLPAFLRKDENDAAKQQ